MDGYSPKVNAYIVAAEILAKAKSQPCRFDRVTTRLVNAELQNLSRRLVKSAARICTRERIAEMCAADPEFARKIGVGLRIMIRVGDPHK